MHKYKLNVVIPNLNGEDMLSACLDSLRKQTLKHNVIVVDNGSTDDSLSILDNFPEVKVIKKETNTGFTGGVNTGIEAALNSEADFIALLNNDAVVEDEWLEKLVQAAGDSANTGIVTSKILLEDKVHLDSTGDFLTIWGVPFPRGRHEVDEGQYDDKTDIFGASGGASLYRAEMLREIGLFDDDYFAYLEDVDLSFRAQAAGWKVRYEPAAIVYHKLSKTSSALGKDFGFYHFVKNFMLLYARNMPLKLYLKYFPLFTLHFLRLFASSLKHKRPHVFVKAIFAAIKLHPQTLHTRKERKKRWKISINEMDKKLYRGLPPRPPRLEDRI